MLYGILAIVMFTIATILIFLGLARDNEKWIAVGFSCYGLTVLFAYCEVGRFILIPLAIGAVAGLLLGLLEGIGGAQNEKEN